MAFGPKEKNQISGRIVHYYVKKSDPDIANNNDQVVTFIFDNEDRLIQVRSNTPGIQNRP